MRTVTVAKGARVRALLSRLVVDEYVERVREVSLDDRVGRQRARLGCPLDRVTFDVGPVDEVSELGHAQGLLEPLCDDGAAVLAVQVGALDLLAVHVGPVEAAFFVADRQPVRATDVVEDS